MDDESMDGDFDHSGGLSINEGSMQKIIITASAKVFLLICLVSLFGCEVNKTSFPSGQTTNQHQTVESAASIDDRITTLAPTITSQPPTNTNTSTVLGKTATIISSPTWTPLATLVPEKALSFTEDLMRENAGCTLPCWWGIIPGKTSWVEAEHFMRSFATSIGQGDKPRDQENGETILVTNYSVDYHTQNGLGIVGFVVRSGKVTKITVGPYGTHSFYPLHKFLTIYGKPREIYLHTFSDSWGDGLLPFDIAMFYPDQGIAFVYHLQGEKVDGNVRGCIDTISDPSLYLWKPGTVIGFEDVHVRGLDSVNEKSLETATELDIDTLYEASTTSDNPICIETPAELWP
ncbi:MAG: hypothetical protein P8074_22455 [Anaerolineales bacterium]|jgi:hypothetical protein